MMEMAEPVIADVMICDRLRQRDATKSRAEVISSLRESPRRIPSRLFYDSRGSKLFEEITGLPEYYPTRTERSILERHSARLVGGPAGLNIVELGSGDCSKVSILLDAIPRECLPSTGYIPVDVSRSALTKSARTLRKAYPGLRIRCLRADFCRCMSMIPANGRKLVLFLGGTIGNLPESGAHRLLRGLAGSMGPDDRLLLGLDMLKDRDVLERAYNDSQGVTAEFNRNILRVTNRLLDSNFKPEQYVHRAFLNEEQSRVEMHLEASGPQRVSSPWLDDLLEVQNGERIHTESSRKYTTDDMVSLAHNAGFAIRDVLTDARRRFSLAELERA